MNTNKHHNLNSIKLYSLIKKDFLWSIIKNYHIYNPNKIFLPFTIIPKKFMINAYIWKDYYTANLSVNINHYKNTNCVYISMPKSACSSIARTLLLNENKKLGEDISLIHHNNSKYQINKKLFYKLKQFSHVFSFTFVRNPFDRILSCYNDKILSRKSNEIPKLYNQIPSFKNFSYRMTFLEFLENIEKIPNKFSEKHFCPQSYRLEKSKVCLDFIGKVESKKDWFFVENKLNLKNKFFVINKSEKTEHYYTDKERVIVLKKYKKDFQLWYPEELKKYKHLL